MAARGSFPDCSKPYDAIVIGARCGGSPTAMLLARKGYRVLLVDRVVFPADTMRNHFIQHPGVVKLHEWGLLDQLIASGCPPVRKHTIDLGDFPLPMPLLPADGVDADYGPRRYVLDTLLVRAAEAAGAEVREGFSVRELLFDGDRVVGIRGSSKSGGVVTERAGIVVGADGLHSMVAKAVDAPVYDLMPSLTCGYYSYFSEVAADGLCAAICPGFFALAFPTHKDLVCVAVQLPISEFPAFRGDLEQTFFRTLARAPWIRDLVKPERREERWQGTADLPNFFRKSYGPGWALVGDAGYHKDPLTAQGISDAFRDADLLATAIDNGFSGAQPMMDALNGYERARNDAARPRFEEVIVMARFGGVPPRVLQQRAAYRAAAA